MPLVEAQGHESWGRSVDRGEIGGRSGTAPEPPNLGSSGKRGRYDFSMDAWQSQPSSERETRPKRTQLLSNPLPQTSSTPSAAPAGYLGSVPRQHSRPK